jgi:ABC-type uncharacterized transport system substrate-binding protein
LIRKSDGIVIPKLGIPPEDLDKINAACKNKNAFLFAQAEGIMPNSAICGYSADLEFMGHKVAEYLFEILYNKKPISELPVKIYPSPSRLVVSKTAMIRHGIVMGPEDFHIILDGEQHRFTLRHLYSFVAPHMSLLEIRLHKELLEAGLRTNDGSEYRPVLQEGRCYDEDFTAEQAVYILEDEFPFIVTVGTRMASRLQHAMVKRGIFKPMVVIAYADDTDAELLSDTCPEWPNYAHTRTVTIPMVKPEIFPSITKLLQPHTKSVGCVYSFCADNLPPHISNRLGVVQEHCEKNGLTFFHDGDSRSNQTFDLVCKDIIKKTDSLFTLPDGIRNSDLMFAARNCHASNTFILGGDDDNFHMVSGILAMDYSEIVKQILAHIVDLSWERTPQQQATALDLHDVYYFYLNEPWLRTHGVELPKNITQLFGITVLRDPYNDDNFDPPGKDQDEINKRLERPLFVDEEEYKKRFNKKEIL